MGSGSLHRSRMANAVGRPDAIPHDGWDVAVNTPAWSRDSGGLASAAPPPAPVTWPEGYTAAACLPFDLDAESAVLTAAITSVYRITPMSHQPSAPLVVMPRL